MEPRKDCLNCSRISCVFVTDLTGLFFLIYVNREYKIRDAFITCFIIFIIIIYGVTKKEEIMKNIEDAASWLMASLYFMKTDHAKTPIQFHFDQIN